LTKFSNKFEKITVDSIIESDLKELEKRYVKAIQTYELAKSDVSMYKSAIVAMRRHQVERKKIYEN
jgi:hypothetical protein